MLFLRVALGVLAAPGGVAAGHDGLRALAGGLQLAEAVGGAGGVLPGAAGELQRHEGERGVVEHLAEMGVVQVDACGPGEGGDDVAGGGFVRLEVGSPAGDEEILRLPRAGGHLFLMPADDLSLDLLILPDNGGEAGAGDVVLVGDARDAVVDAFLRVADVLRHADAIRLWRGLRGDFRKGVEAGDVLRRGLLARIDGAVGAEVEVGLRQPGDVLEGAELRGVGREFLPELGMPARGKRAVRGDGGWWWGGVGHAGLRVGG